MKQWIRKFLLILILGGCLHFSYAQCSICSKTSAQQGEKAGKGMNGGIIYLMMMPLAIMGFVGYRWWRQEKGVE